MTALAHELAAVRSAVDDFLSAADGCAATWTTPPAPGKWSPSQVLEHVALSLEESAKDMHGHRSRLPSLPAPARFLARHLLFGRVLRNGALPRAKTNRAMNPLAGPETPEEGRRRLEAAGRAFEESAANAGDRAESRVFGNVALADYVRFQAIHLRHHRAQLPGA